MSYCCYLVHLKKGEKGLSAQLQFLGNVPKDSLGFISKLSILCVFSSKIVRCNNLCTSSTDIISLYFLSKTRMSLDFMTPP